MITLQPQLEPATTLEWKFYKPTTFLDWLHTEQRDILIPDQVAPAKDPITVIPTAVFTISTYVWNEVAW